VAEQRLDGANIGPPLEEVCCERMAKAVRGDPLCDARFAHCPLDGLVDDTRIGMMTSHGSAPRIRG
jgi:hypothetical protein